MYQVLFVLLFLTSCSNGTFYTGGKDPYRYLSNKEYSTEDLKELAPEIIETSWRDPVTGKSVDLFKKEQKDIKRIAIVVFESLIQPTISGLAGDNKIYMSAQGKQLLTERLLNVWEQSLKTIAPEIDYISVNKLKNNSVFLDYGLQVDDHIQVSRERLDPDDIFYLPRGKETTMTTVVNPRGMRDLSLFLVPGSELMGGPKWSEHAKHFVNDLAKEFNYDAVLVIMNDIAWTSAHVDKHSKESFQEEITLNLKQSVLIPFSEYHKRLKAIGISERPNVNVCFRTYESTIKHPIKISVAPEQENFETVEKEILNPLTKIYADLTQMMVYQLKKDLEATY